MIVHNIINFGTAKIQTDFVEQKIRNLLMGYAAVCVNIVVWLGNIIMIMITTHNYTLSCYKQILWLLYVNCDILSRAASRTLL